MEAKPAESETIETSEPVEEIIATDPVSEFKKGKTKRESKRKEVKVITEYVPDPPAASTTPLPAAVEIPDAESIASRAAEIVFSKMVAEKNAVDKTPESKTKARPKLPAKKKEATPPPTKYFGWC